VTSTFPFDNNVAVWFARALIRGSAVEIEEANAPNEVVNATVRIAANANGSDLGLRNLDFLIAALVKDVGFNLWVSNVII
jgi:hypothetical protein